MRILVTDGMDKQAMAKLRELGHEVVEQFYEPDQLGAALREFDAVVVRSKTKIRANHIDEAKGGKLKLIIRGGVGVDNIDVKYAEENGITVKNTPKASSESVAELALGHMFSCARYLSIAGHTMREDKWEKKAYGKGIELRGKTLGIVGFGRIGKCLARKLQSLGAAVTVASRKAEDRAWCAALGYRPEQTHVYAHGLTYDCVLNTVPAPVFTEAQLATLRCPLVDLASAPGGLPLACDPPKLYQRAPGLPGRFAPERAARILKETTLRILSEEQEALWNP